MAFARMARWADDLTLLLAPGVKLFMRKSQNLEVHEVTYRLFLEHGGGVYEKKTERQQFSRVVTDSRRCLLPHHREVEPREMPRETAQCCRLPLSNLLGRRLADAMLSSTQLLSLPLTFLLFITLLQHHV